MPRFAYMPRSLERAINAVLYKLEILLFLGSYRTSVLLLPGLVKGISLESYLVVRREVVDFLTYQSRSIHASTKFPRKRVIKNGSLCSPSAGAKLPIHRSSKLFKISRMEFEETPSLGVLGNRG